AHRHSERSIATADSAPVRTGRRPLAAFARSKGARPTIASCASSLRYSPLRATPRYASFPMRVLSPLRDIGRPTEAIQRERADQLLPREAALVVHDNAGRLATLAGSYRLPKLALAPVTVPRRIPLDEPGRVCLRESAD